MKMQQRKWTDFLGSPIRRFAVCSAEREYTRSLKCPLQTLVTPFKTFDPQIDHVHDNLLVAVAAVISTKLFFSDFPCGNRLCIFQQVHLPADPLIIGFKEIHAFSLFYPMQKIDQPAKAVKDDVEENDDQS